jgi:hypothetical protein
MEHLPELVKGGAHLGFDGSHGAAHPLGNFLVGQLPVLPE